MATHALDVVRQTSRDRQLTLRQASRELLKEKALAGRAAQRPAALYGAD
ncbi:hypothetical protein LN650_00350 [Klebsiella pneumoniae subsp. pneumoniae]|nr:hypothetical protein [Klebsiella pneumoniae subsp. pneumoniae]